MEDIPQPASQPYEVGDRVRVYVGEEDRDSAYHAEECVVVERQADQLHEETGRDLDQWTYALRITGSDTAIPVTFRHWDLVPLEK